MQQDHPHTDTFLLKGGPQLERSRQDSMSTREILAVAESFWKISTECAVTFLTIYPRILSFLSTDQFAKWTHLGWQTLSTSKGGPDLCRNYIESSAVFLSSETFEYLSAWVRHGLAMNTFSPKTAAEYFRSTPAFLAHEKIFQLKQWADSAKQILDKGGEREAAAIAFLQSSGPMRSFLPLPEFKEWKETGLQMARLSPRHSADFFSSTPTGLDALYRTEIKRVFGMVGLILKFSPKKAVAFYQDCPKALLALNPNVREAVMKTALKISREAPEKIAVSFDAIVSALTPLSYPAQEIVLELETRIGKASIDAAIAYFSKMASLLSEISESFLPHWVKKGLSLLHHNIQEGIDYFSLNSQDADDERVRWKEAVLLEDNQHLFSIYVHSLSGKKMHLKSTESLNPADVSPLRPYPSANGQTIYLPPVITEGRTREANFRFYKVSCAHQAGYIEFGTFDPKFDLIWPVLASFPDKELVSDIFFMVEDGRIDHLLKKEYRGLKPELERAVSEAVKRRAFPKKPLILAAMEALLRLCAGCLDPDEAPEALSAHVNFLKRSLAGFFENASSVWDSFLKATDIYEAFCDLLTNDDYIPVLPLPFHERPDLEDLPGSGVREDLPDEIKKPEKGRDGDGIPLSPEQLKELLEKLEDLSVLESLEEEISSQGLYLTSIDGLEKEAGEKKPQADEDPRENRLVATRISRSTDHKGPFFYDEWDYIQGAYRKKWCCLREKQVDEKSPARFNEITDNYRDLIQKVRRQFQQIRPENLEPIRRVEWGDEIDLPALIEGVVDRKTGTSPSDKIFSRKEKKIRRVSTLLLMDMSASTDEKASAFSDNAPGQPGQEDKKIIDIEIESLVVMTEALDALGDDFAIFGFSGQGRENVDFYAIKDFQDIYSENLKMRISGIEPQQSTRMGPAIRHATEKLRGVEAEHRLLILLSDGFPQDLDYGEDRKSKEYALNDTMMALIEAKNQEIRPFCITVDQTGNDYLRKMCDPRSYLIIKNIYSLPEILPKVVESLMD